MEQVLQENEFLNKQIPLLTGKLETYRARLMEKADFFKDQDSHGQRDSRIKDLENEIQANKEKIRMNSQLTQALGDSVKREEQLKKQCDQLLESLHSALAEDEKLAMRIAQMEQNSDEMQKLFKSKEDELMKLKNSAGIKNDVVTKRSKPNALAQAIEKDIEIGANKWKQLKYCYIEGLTDKENFEMLRKVLDYREKFLQGEGVNSILEKSPDVDIFMGTGQSKDLHYSELEGKRNSSYENFEDALLERENDIKDLLKDYERLQVQYKDLEKVVANRDSEILQLREKLAFKSNQLVNIYQNQESQSTMPVELNSLKKQYLELLSSHQMLNSQLTLLHSKGKDYSDLLQEFLDNEIDKETLINQIEESFKWRLSIEVESIESELIQDLQKKIDELEKKYLQEQLDAESLRIEITALKNLIEEEKKIEKDGKNNKNEWKKYRRDHVLRVEKIYMDEISELKTTIAKSSEIYQEKEMRLIALNKKYEKELRDLTQTLKKEHESKKKITELFTKEKENCEKLKETISQQKAEQENFSKRYSDTKTAFEDSNRKIFKLEQEIQKNAEIEDNANTKEKLYKDQIEEYEVIKTRLYNEITRLNKQIQEQELDKSKLIVEKKSSIYFSEESKENFLKELQGREDKISSLEKENFKLKNEVFELDVRLKSSENDNEKMQVLKKNLSDMQKQVLGYEILTREKQYLESENKTIREDLKNAQSSIQQLKMEIRSLSTELLDMQKDLAISNNNGRKSESPTVTEELQAVQSRLSSLNKEFQIIKNELDKANEEKSSLVKNKKQLEGEISALKSESNNLKGKISALSQPKEMPSEFTNIKEKVQEIEMKYESLEACQDEMILTMRKIYKDWCTGCKISMKKFNGVNDPTREAVQVLEHVIAEYKKSIDLRRSQQEEDLKEILQRAQSLLSKMDSQPDSTYKAHTLRLLTENISLKQELLQRHQRALADERIFKELENVQGINDWALEKWKDSEKDAVRLRDQLLQVTIELEKHIKLAKESSSEHNQTSKSRQSENIKTNKDSDLEYILSEREYFKQKNYELEQELSKTDKDKQENRLLIGKLEKEKDLWKKAMLEVSAKIIAKPVDMENPSLIMTQIFNYLDLQQQKAKASNNYSEYLDEIQHLQDEIEYLRSRTDSNNYLQQENKKLEEVLQGYKTKEVYMEKKVQELMNKQGDSGLISALYEEKKLREELEEELTEKCNLIEKILKEYDENKKYLKL